jgi:mono/diheme cytochrome c family protein
MADEILRFRACATPAWRYRRAASLLLLAAACASPPAVAPDAACPAPGPRIAPQGRLGTAGDAERGERLFADACQGCHADVAALRAPEAPANAPRLDCPAWLAEASDAYLYDAISRGPGRYGHADQPPMGLQLTPTDVSDLVAYLRSLARGLAPRSEPKANEGRISPAASEPTRRR